MKTRIRIMTVCSFGIGTSLILKMKVDEVMMKNGIDADVFPCDVTTGVTEPCDICLTSAGIAHMIAGKISAPMVIIDNFLDMKEIEEKSLYIIREIMNN